MKPTQQRITSLLAIIVLVVVFCAMISKCDEKPDSAKAPTTMPVTVLTQAQLQQEMNAVRQQAIETQSGIYESLENLKALISRMGELQQLQKNMQTVKVDTTGKK